MSYKKHQKLQQDINVPFNIKIPAGHSKFIIPVPKAFNDRMFQFSELTLMPDYLSLLAADFQMDTDEELDELVDFPMYLSAGIQGNLYPGIISIPSTIVTTPALIQFLNPVIEGLKPEGLKRLGLFFDWTDLTFVPGKETWDDYVKDKAMEYYGEVYNPGKHFNALPVSARDVKGANNYLFPTMPSDETRLSLRFRMHVAPNTVGMYSSDLQLYDLGFTRAQLGKRNAKKQYEFRNEKDGDFQMFQAEEEYIQALNKKTPLKISLTILTDNFISASRSVLVTRRQVRTNTEMLTAVKKTLLELVDLSNINLGLTYDNDEKIKKFTFSFPANPVLNVTLHPAVELSNRLGFNLISNITKRNATSTEKCEDTPDIKEAEKKARALVYDTRIVIVTDDNSSSMMTVGISEKLMASLMPFLDGSLKMSQCDITPPKMRLPSVFTGSSDVVPATFKLHRFLDHENLVNLQWKHDGYVFGVLRGTYV
jgi:hypothetical protein